MDGADVYRLRHTLQGHAKEEDPSNLQVHGQIDKDLAQCRDLWLVLDVLVGHRLAILSHDARGEGQRARLL